MWSKYPNHYKIVQSEILTPKEKCDSFVQNLVDSYHGSQNSEYDIISFIHMREAMVFSAKLFFLENTYIAPLPIGKHKDIVFAVEDYKCDSLDEFYDMVKTQSDFLFVMYTIEFHTTLNKWVARFGKIIWGQYYYI